MSIKIVLGLLVLALPIWAKSSKAAPPATPTWAEFQSFCLRHASSYGEARIPAPALGQVSYIPVQVLLNQQSDFSFRRLEQQLRKGLNEGAYFNKKKQTWVLAHDEGRSLFNSDSDLMGVFYRGRVYLADGHHKALASIYIGAETAPVHIIDDWSELTSREFVEAMADAGYSHWQNYRGQKINPMSFCEMENNANLMLARLLIRRIVVTEEKEKLRLKLGSGSEWPIALKINHDISFMEREMADALTRAGVAFDDTRGDKDIGKKERKRYLQILQKVARRHPRLSQILFLKKPSRVEALDLEALIREHLALPGCEKKLLARSN